MAKKVLRLVLSGAEANSIYDILSRIEETVKLPSIDLTEADDTEVLTAYAVSIASMNIDGVETVLLCPPSPPIDVEVLSLRQFSNANQLAKYIIEKRLQKKIVVVYDDTERDYIILK